MLGDDDLEIVNLIRSDENGQVRCAERASIRLSRGKKTPLLLSHPPGLSFSINDGLGQTSAASPSKGGAQIKPFFCSTIKSTRACDILRSAGRTRSAHCILSTDQCFFPRLHTSEQSFGGDHVAVRRVRGDKGRSMADTAAASRRSSRRSPDDEDDALQISPGGHEAKKKDSICVIEGR